MEKKIKGIPQNKKNSSYWPRLNSEIHGWINWDWKGNEINTFIKSFGKPYVGAHTHYVRIKKFILKIVNFLENTIFTHFNMALFLKLIN